ncbi:hypothetical protein R5H30_04140 [Sulfitobacter sp. D35]|uniref:hypothetical protein n=1 Tax=Sulfitobacter sp. D35 TaxID=3083252 RepID=UPI00296EEBD8|nr:hypothetical protein [Sulfitobacter sp. D35]MDW4497161.1 hypothetical protein [Sulfitobacter sp. D35]
MRNLYWLTDMQMARLEAVFPEFHGRPKNDLHSEIREAISDLRPALGSGPIDLVAVGASG